MWKKNGWKSDDYFRLLSVADLRLAGKKIQSFGFFLRNPFTCESWTPKTQPEFLMFNAAMGRWGTNLKVVISAKSHKRLQTTPIWVILAYVPVYFRCFLEKAKGVRFISTNFDWVYQKKNNHPHGFFLEFFIISWN